MGPEVGLGGGWGEMLWGNGGDPWDRFGVSYGVTYGAGLTHGVSYGAGLSHGISYGV